MKRAINYHQSFNYTTVCIFEEIFRVKATSIIQQASAKASMLTV
jgi:hypothetical protein